VSNPLILLDISRLLSRAGRPAPTGIDRVELAYAENLPQRFPGDVRFVARGPLQEITLLPTGWAQAFVQALAARWRGDAPQSGLDPKTWALLLHAQLILNREWELHLVLLLTRRAATYLLVSHTGLDSPGSIARLKRFSRVRFVCLVHDLIPMELPELAGEGQDERHARRMATVARLADEVVVNSASTARALTRFCETAGRVPPIHVAELGVAMPTETPSLDEDATPYFVVLSTIEPKKNHLMLLDIWRELAAEGPAPPHLVLIGQRGWKTEAIAEALSPGHFPPGLVEEHNALPDRDVRRLLAGARALLAPSLAEGYGLPVAEALALGTPVICSDIPAHRDVGGGAPDYLDPRDAAGWRAAIGDYAEPGSARRAAQLRRLKGWKAPSWDAHFARVAPLIAPG
jgi:glycosyltransferase involved in cell wall biosynthesis